VSQEYLCHVCGQSNPLEKLLYRPRGRKEGVEEDQPHWVRNPQSRGLRPVTDLLGSPVHRALRALFGEDSQTLQSLGQVVLHCPVCQEPLSDRNVVQGSHAAFLGIFGPRTSGKTLFLISLIQDLGLQQIDGKTLGLVGLGDSNDRLNALVDQLRRGERPDRTRPERADSTKLQRFAWELQLAGPDRRRIPPMLLSMYDISGEDLAKPHQEDLPVLESYCRAVTSMVFLIDGKAVTQDLGLSVKDAWDPDERPGATATAEIDVLRNVRDRIGGQRAKQAVDLALVLSKADYLWDRAGWKGLKPENHQASGEDVEPLMQTLLADSGRSGLMTEAQGFRQVKLFAASSLGFRPGKNDVKNGLLTSTAKINPYGVTDAVLWLLGLRLRTKRRPSS